MHYFFSGCESEDLMEFSADIAVNPFGAELARISAEVYEDIDEAIEDITDGLLDRGIDVDEEMVYGFFSGEFLPTEETLEALSEFCVDENGEVDTLALDRLVTAAEASYDLAEGYEDEMYDEYDDEYEDDYDPEYYDEVDEEIEGYYDDEYEDEYSDEDEEDYIDPETEALRDQVEELTTRQIVTDDLDSLVEYGKALVAEGKLPPIAFQALLGDGEETSTSRFAEFSSVCAEDESDDVYSRLDKIDFCLQVFEQCGPFMDFSSMAPEDLEYDEYDADEEFAASAMLDAYRSI